MKNFVVAIAAVAAVISLVASAPAQFSGGMTGAQSIPSINGQNTTSTVDEFAKLKEYEFKARKLSAEDKKKGKTLAQALAEDKAAAIELVKVLPLSCEVTDAMEVAEGPVTTADGATVNTKTYEVTCANGLGYLLVWRDVGKPDGFSCFVADATRVADIAAKRKPGVACQLPGNADLKQMGTVVLSKIGITCPVRDYRLIGQSTADHTEFVEFACPNNQGYIVVSAVPGSAVPVRADTCQKSAARGLPCKFSDNGAELITLKTFREALTKHGIVCDAADKTTYLFGQQTRSKRHVVEFQCWQYPKGLVAFIPLGDNPAPFESMDCPSAKQKYGVVCVLNK